MKTNGERDLPAGEQPTLMADLPCSTVRGRFCTVTTYSSQPTPAMGTDHHLFRTSNEYCFLFIWRLELYACGQWLRELFGKRRTIKRYSHITEYTRKKNKEFQRQLNNNDNNS